MVVLFGCGGGDGSVIGNDVCGGREQLGVATCIEMGVGWGFVERG